MKELKAALFDLDGVVFDTEPQYTIFWGEQCREFHPEHSGLEIEIKGQTLTQIYDAWFSGDLFPARAIITDRLNAFEEHMKFEYVKGFEAFLTDLRNHHVKTAVVTSSNLAKMQSVYHSHPEFLQLFDAVLTSEDFAESKPSPDCYLRAAERFNTRPEECIVFEDSVNGLLSGRSSKMFVVGLMTTNPLETVKPLSDIQIMDYNNIDYNRLVQLWQVI